jgi:hypothetical protein
MSTKRLLTKHPALRRIEQVFAFMEECGVSFEFDPYGTIHAVVDGRRFRFRDLEHQAFEGSGIYELPPLLEYAALIDEE